MTRDHERRTSCITDEMVEAAHARIHENVHEDFHFPTPICVEEALAAALSAAPDSGSPYWLCLVRGDGGRMFTRRRYCEQYECPGPHHALLVGPALTADDQPLPDATG